jgi:hypothetical protein
MLFPTDPDKKPLLWESIVEQLAVNPVQILVDDGIYHEDSTGHILMNDKISSLVEMFKKSDFKRFGASRNIAIGPYWAFSQAGSRLNAKIFLIPASEGERASQSKIKNEIEAIAVNIYFENKDIDEILIPLEIMAWQLQDWDSESTNEGLLLTKK